MPTHIHSNGGTGTATLVPSGDIYGLMQISNTGSTGGGDSQNLQPYEVCNYIIKL